MYITFPTILMHVAAAAQHQLLLHIKELHLERCRLLRNKPENHCQVSNAKALLLWNEESESLQIRMIALVIGIRWPERNADMDMLFWWMHYHSSEGTSVQSSYGAERKLCIKEGCANMVRQGGVCTRHGTERKLCSRKGCTSMAAKGGVCVRHGAKVKDAAVNFCTFTSTRTAAYMIRH